MKTIYLIFIFSVLMFYSCGSDPSNQESDSGNTNIETEVTKNDLLPVSLERENNPYRDENWDPENGNYFFSELWTFSYTNEMLLEGEPGVNGETHIYVDPFSGIILLTRDDSNYMDEMTDWVLVHPEGKYEWGQTGEHGKRTISSKVITELHDYDLKNETVMEDFNQLVKRLEGQKTFGGGKNAIETEVGYYHELSYLKTNDKTSFYLARMPFKTQAFNLINELSDDLQMPIDLNIGYSIPDDYLVLGSKYTYLGNTVKYKLVSIGATSYFLSKEGYLTGE